MSIIINGMEMPQIGKYEATITVFADGRAEISIVTEYHSDNRIPSIVKPFVLLNYPLVALPPHGDLIDRNELLSTKTDPIHKMMIFGGQYVISEDAIKNAPVVIPAERSDSE